MEKQHTTCNFKLFRSWQLHMNELSLYSKKTPTAFVTVKLTTHSVPLTDPKLLSFLKIKKVGLGDQIKIYSITKKCHFCLTLIRSHLRCMSDVKNSGDSLVPNLLLIPSSFHAFTSLEIRLMKILVVNSQPTKNNRNLKIGLNVVCALKQQGKV